MVGFNTLLKFFRPSSITPCVNARCVSEDIHNQGNNLTCWAFAIATAIREAQEYFKIKDIAIYDHQTIVNKLLGGEHARNGARPYLDEVLTDKTCSEYGLKAEKINKSCAWDAVKKERVVIAYYYLTFPQKTKFDTFFNNNKNRKGVLQYDSFDIWKEQSTEQTTKIYENRVGHAVVIVDGDEQQNCWKMKNSWGTDFADKGYFRVCKSSFHIEEFWILNPKAQNSIAQSNSEGRMLRLLAVLSLIFAIFAFAALLIMIDNPVVRRVWSVIKDSFMVCRLYT